MSGPGSDGLRTVRKLDQDRRASLGQERLWTLSSLAQLDYAYQVALAVRLSGELDVAALVTALHRLGRRHDSLRTTFSQAGGVLLREVAAPDSDPSGAGAGATITPSSAVTVEPVATRSQAQARIRAAATARFDLATGPPWRAHLYPAGPTEAVLLLVAHHLVCDGWSLGILFRELAADYNGLVRGELVELPPLPFGYGDYAAWQRRRLAEGGGAESLRYWRARLRGAPPLELPTDHIRPPVASLRGGVCREALPAEVVALLPARCRAHGVTAYQVGLAAFVALLARYTGQRDLCLGTAIADRTVPGTESLVGFLVNNLVLRLDATGDPRFTDLLARTRRVVLAALTHQDVPFERLVEVLAPERDLSRNPLFQVVFTDQQHPVDRSALTGLTAEEIPIDLDVSKFDLSVVFSAESPTPEVAAHFSTDLFTPETVSRLLRNYLTLLTAALRAPDTRLSELAVLPAEERATVTRDWNDTAVPLPTGSTVCDLIAEHARRSGDRPAIRTPQRGISYRQLHWLADQLADRLVELGVGPGTPVGLLAPRCAEAVVALLGILRAGGGYVPLDPSHPSERLRTILDHSGAPVLVTMSTPDDPVATGRRVLPVPDLDQQPGREAAPAPPSRARPDELAYLIYTSGSTGQPKGVAVSHQALLRFVHRQTYGRLAPDQTRLQLSPYSFDASLIEVWSTLTSGGCVAIPDHRLDLLEYVTQAVERLGVDTALFVSPQLHLLVQRRPGLLRRLREVLVGGDVLSVPHGRRAAELVDGPLIHVYGPTECTLFATATRVHPDRTAAATLPIGRPIANTRAYVLDESLQPVPIGAPGELLLAGPGLAWGYIGQSGLTAASFRPDPFSQTPGERMYATGDRARWLADGQLEFLGRLDSQVKLRGYRIELGEVERAVSAHPGVRDARVVLREELPGGPGLVAYVVGGSEVTEDGVRQLAHRHLPGFMVPRQVAFVDRIPLTGNGKVDLARLPAPPPPRHEPAAPTDEVEAAVHRLWQQVLNQDRAIPVDVKFFEVGGDSITLISLFDEVQRRFPDTRLSLVDLFTYSTIRGLAGQLRRSNGAG